MWFGLYGGFPIGSGGCSSQRLQHTEQGRPMQASVVGVNEEPRKDGQQGCRRGAGRGKVHGVEGAGRCRRGDPLRCHGRKTRSTWNSKGCCSFSNHYLYETATSLSFHPTTNIMEGGTWRGGESCAVLWDCGQSRSLQGGMKRGMNGVLGENGNSPLAPRPALLRGVPCSR